MRDEIKRWFDQALSELSVAEVTLPAKKFGATVYHCQQAAELSLKALYMLQRSKDAPRSHSLVFLGQETGAFDRFGDFLRELTPAYTDTRYPDAAVESPELIYGGNRAERIYRQTKEFLEWIQSELEKISGDSFEN